MSAAEIGPTPLLARATGFCYLLIAVLGGAAYFLVSQTLIVAGDAAATASAIRADLALLRFGVMAYLATLALDVITAWLLYLLLAPADRAVALLAAWLRLAYTFVHGAAVLNLVTVLDLAEGGLSAAPAELRDGLILHYCEAHLSGFMISLALFGCHLLVVSWLVFRSGYLPKLLAFLLAPAGLAYILDTSAMVLMANYAALQPMTEPVVAVVAMVGEIGFLLWLLIMGVKAPARA